jgi:hypothetical protein
MYLIDYIYEYVTSTIFNYDPTGPLSSYASLIEAWALITTFMLAFVIFTLIIKLIIRLVGKVGSMFMGGGRFY